MDLRPGGQWRHTMRGPDGTEYPNHSIFTEVVKPERIVFVHAGRKAGGPDADFVATWTFDAVGERQTRLTVRMVFETPEARDTIVKTYGAIEGAEQTLARLAEHLAPSPLVIERVFAAPPDAVWRAITEVERMRQWFMPDIPAFRAEGRIHHGIRPRVRGQGLAPHLEGHRGRARPQDRLRLDLWRLRG